MTVVASQDADGPLEVRVLDMFRRSERQWIIAGSLDRGSLSQGQRVRLRVAGSPSVGAVVTSFNLSSVSLPNVDFIIDTDTDIVQRLPATIYPDDRAR